MSSGGSVIVYLRATVKRTRRGESVRYLQLAHNERNERGVPVARVIHNFGREDQLDREALGRLVRSIQRFLGGEETLRLSTLEGFRFISAPEAGGPHALGQLWSQLGIGKAIARVAGRGRGRSGVERAIFAMVCQRCLEPASKLEATRWLGRDVVLDGIAAVSDDELYRAMDFLLVCSERVQESVFFSLANLLNLEVDVIFFDTTSTYFEVDVDGEAIDDDEQAGEQVADRRAPEPLRRLGHWKDHRPDLPQVVIGLAVTREGIPVRVWVWPGNANDQTLVAQVKHDLAGWRLGRAIYVVCHNPAGAERDRARRQQRLERIEAELARLAEQRQRAATTAEREAHLRGECALRDHPTLSRYLRQTSSGRLLLDRAKIAAEERLDGKYLLTTSDPSLSAEDVAFGYKQLQEAERSFRDLKGTPLLRPVFHSKDDRIRAHVLICFLALVLVRLAETRTGETWRTIRAELSQIRQGHFHSADGDFTQTSELTTRQRDLHADLGVPEPPRFGRITPTVTRAA